MAKPVYTEKDILEMIAKGGKLELPEDAILTPSARDRLSSSSFQRKPQVVRMNSSQAPVKADTRHTGDPVLPDYTYRWENHDDPVGKEAILRFYHSPEIEAIKQRMCAMGERMWKKDYVDGNGGNLVVRVGKNLFLTTQTLISKGYMTPESIALVDFDGKQLAGKFKRTSECLTHLAIYKVQPKARATCHAHPPHATAFAVANVQPPTCMIPEAEVFLGQIGMAEYQTPGTPANAEAVGEVAKDHHAILMVNHGVITWGDHIEDAYWKMENVDAYCKTIWIASQLGNGFKTITQDQARELIELRKSLGMADKRESWRECELCDNSEFRPGVICQVPPADPKNVNSVSENREAEALIGEITSRIMEEIGER